ncbi:type II toxin-antitoxin system Phd/YefM family antitoxin [Deinococcus sp.]|uniref:type II toxin-antitoxin system Phd/YefM family antitoxin n=1 Tax=Deinococcus sp. TaxID=47478 RepID=UPI0025C07BEF|nr:type II toxin-antitoxin system Phd/YefM family antitoxin [Deinococcus sp.]
MTAYCLKYFEQNASRIVKEASESTEMITVTLDNGESVVIMPSRRAAGLTETELLSANPANRQHILAAIEDDRQGYIPRKSLEELDTRQS